MTDFSYITRGHRSSCRTSTSSTRGAKEARTSPFFSFYLSVFRPLTSLLRFLISLVALRDRFGKMRLNLSDVANGRGKMDNIRRNVSLSFRGGKKFLFLSSWWMLKDSQGRDCRRIVINTNPLPDQVIFDTHYRQYMWNIQIVTLPLSLCFR